MDANNPPNRIDTTPQSESPPPDRGSRSRKIGAMIGYAAALFLGLSYAALQDKDVLLFWLFVTGVILFLPLYLVVWHPKRLKIIEINFSFCKLHAPELLAKLKFWKKREKVWHEDAPAISSRPTRTDMPESAPNISNKKLDKKLQQIASDDKSLEAKPGKKNGNSAIRKGAKRKKAS
ncbi:hypothetical protein [Psychromicrobium xiongbiense]|uniref:hypothetical protein n=1 Tax=Psychromicrobium xiongbiense TaxID=3051184 RepID=UPI0025576A39|nr:hypothetical protein [Psychromicrobium sp. YIM S02556]